jgi:heme o synthase
MTSINAAIDRADSWRDYVQLTKPRIAMLLVFTAVSAMVVAYRDLPPALDILGVVLGGWLAAAGASVFNQYVERDLDSLMLRTRKRPLPSGRIEPANALLFGLALLLWSMIVLTVLVNPLAAALALMGAAYYIVIYTLLLKRHTSLNVVIGGGAGGFPVLVGWAAATGTLGIGALLLFTIVFLWTPPHSWALALRIQNDYERGTIPMMPVTRGAATTTVYIYWYTLHLIALTFMVFVAGMLSVLYMVGAFVLGAGLLWYTARLMSDCSKARARQLYKYSSLYLLLLFMVMVFDVLLI